MTIGSVGQTGITLKRYWSLLLVIAFYMPFGAIPANGNAKASAPVASTDIHPFADNRSENLAKDMSPLSLERMGKRIFADPRFSASGRTSCSSCHKPSQSFADGQAFSKRDNGTLTSVQTPPLFDLTEKIGFFSESRVFTLKDVVQRCMEVNLGSSVINTYVNLKRDPVMSRYASHHFGRVSAGAVYQALAAYLKTLETSDSRYDRYLAGNFSALTRSEQDGLLSFTRYGCIYCHTGASLGGMVTVQNSDPASPISLQVPRLRNLSRTPPYFYDGSAEHLDEAIYRMVQQYTIGVAAVDTAADSTGISSEDLKNIRLFLLSHESPVNDFEGVVPYESQH